MDDLRLDAGSLSLNLVATVGRRFGAPVERLSSVERVHEWLAAVGLAAEGSFTNDDLSSLRGFRENLHAFFRAIAAGVAPEAEVVDVVNTAAARAAPQLEVTEGRPTLAAPARRNRALDAVVALIAADAIRIAVGEERGALGICEADDCRMIYLAHGRRGRRWCSGQRCGNRRRVAAHRSRVARAG